jgi:hypothetical protein
MGARRYQSMAPSHQAYSVCIYKKYGLQAKKNKIISVNRRIKTGKIHPRICAYSAAEA